MVTTATATQLTCALLPRQVEYKAGFCGSTRRLQWKSQEKKCIRKAGPGIITAKIDLKPPPYAVNALEPHMSRETLEYHWGKHHRSYVENLNNQIVGTELDGMTLEDIIMVSYNKGSFLPAFNNAAQTWNHQFFWESMKPGGGGKPTGDLLKLIDRDFGSFEAFVEEFKLAASTQFGSGWAWLACEQLFVFHPPQKENKANRLNVGNAVNPRPSEKDKKLVIVKSPNAVNPLLWDYSPILTIDVWEHSYYLDFQNRRVDYISTFMEKLVSWEAVSSRLEIAMDKQAKRERGEPREEEEGQKAGSEVEEMYLDSDSDDSEFD